MKELIHKIKWKYGLLEEKYDKYLRNKSNVEYIEVDRWAYFTEDAPEGRSGMSTYNCRIKEIRKDVYEVRLFDHYKQGYTSSGFNKPNVKMRLYKNSISKVVFK